MTVEPLDAAERRFRAVLGLATIGMLGLSWPLWAGRADFPRVPFVVGIPAVPPWAGWGLFVLLIATIAAGIVRREILGASAVLLLILIAQDQHRFQPWAYQFGMAALALATTSRAKAVGLCRLFLLALYFHSGLSKLDASFCRGLGLTFLETAARPFGMSPSRWPEGVRVAAVLAMPMAEMAIAAGLAFPKTRRAAIVGAVGLHATLIAILGPWGLDQSTIVLVWNAALMVEVPALFGPSESGGSAAGSRLEPWTTLLFALAAILPFGERRGLCDAWPAFAYYAGHVERVEVEVPAHDVEELPESLRRLALGEGPWRRIDLTAWSRAVRGVPVYPQARACLGLAEALAARYRGARALRVTWHGRADRWNGRRESVSAVGLGAIRALGDRCRLNAHPGPAGVGTSDARRGPEVERAGP